MLFDILKSRKEFEVEYQMNKKGVKKLAEAEDHISFLTDSLYNIYNDKVLAKVADEQVNVPVENSNPSVLRVRVGILGNLFPRWKPKNT